MEFFNKISQTTKEITYRILSGMLSSFLFMNVLPTFMFIIYMRENTIFSYDLFISGLFGINVFFFYGILIILLFTLLMTSSLFFGIGAIVKSRCPKLKKDEIVPVFCKYDDNVLDKKKYKQNLNDSLGFFIVSLVTNIIFIYVMYDNNPMYTSYLTFILSICIILTLHFAIVFFTKAKFSILSLLIFFPISVLILYFNSEKTADIVAHGLQSFNSSQKEVVIKNLNGEVREKGIVLLLSPENIFILTQENNETNRTVIIKRDNIIIDIKN